jgi:hypothetical protein
MIIQLEGRLTQFDNFLPITKLPRRSSLRVLTPAVRQP